MNHKFHSSSAFGRMYYEPANEASRSLFKCLRVKGERIEGAQFKSVREYLELIGATVELVIDRPNMTGS